MSECKPEAGLLMGKIGHVAARMHSNPLTFTARISAEQASQPNCGRLRKAIL